MRVKTHLPLAIQHKSEPPTMRDFTFITSPESRGVWGVGCRVWGARPAPTTRLVRSLVPFTLVALVYQRLSEDNAVPPPTPTQPPPKPFFFTGR
jgi:hypothetical protein